MIVRIGVVHTAKDIEVELAADTDVSKLKQQIEEALDDSSEEPKVLWLTDKKDRVIGVPAKRIAYVDLTPRKGGGRVGFGA